MENVMTAIEMTGIIDEQRHIQDDLSGDKVRPVVCLTDPISIYQLSVRSFIGEIPKMW